MLGRVVKGIGGFYYVDDGKNISRSETKRKKLCQR